MVEHERRHRKTKHLERGSEFHSTLCLEANNHAIAKYFREREEEGRETRWKERA